MRWALAISVAIVTAVPSVAYAAAAGQSAPGESNLIWLLAGALMLWAGFFAYVIYLGRKNSDIRCELDELRERLAGSETADRQAEE